MAGLLRSHSLWILSGGGLTLVALASARLAWVAADRGVNLGGAVATILTSTNLEDLLPRLVIAALFIWGGYPLARTGSRRRLLAVAAACALVGVVACLYLLVRYELAFMQAFSKGGASGGWTLGTARAEFLAVPYLSALAQAIFGFVASMALLGIDVLKRSPALP